MSYTVDFKELKEKLKIEDVAEWLQIEFKTGGLQMRGPCPTCQKGGDRALVITPAKAAYFCFADRKGGDLIALTAHVRGCSQKEAAEQIAEQFHIGGAGKNSPSREQSPQPRQDKGFDANAYAASLEAEHEAVEAVGFDPSTARALGIGFSSKGVLGGTVAVPVRLEDGTLAGYIGITEARLPSRWNLRAKVVPLRRPA